MHSSRLKSRRIDSIFLSLVMGEELKVRVTFHDYLTPHLLILLPQGAKKVEMAKLRP